MHIGPWRFILAAVVACVVTGQEITEKPQLSQPQYEQPTVTSSHNIQGISPLVTPPPDLELLKQKRANDPFIGYWSYSGQWNSWNCPSGQYFAADSTWGACCNTASAECIYPTGCIGINSAVYVNGATGDCGATGLCDTVTLFNTRGAVGTGVRSVIQCFGTSGFYDFPRSLYRASFALTTTSPTPTVTAVVTEKVTVKPNSASRPLDDGCGPLWPWLATLGFVFLGALI